MATIPRPSKLWYNHKTLIYKRFIVVVLFVFGVSFTAYAYSAQGNLNTKKNNLPPDPLPVVAVPKEVMLVTQSEYQKAKHTAAKPESISQITSPLPEPPVFTKKIVKPSIEEVIPFYSQFTDISAVKWQKVGCGIASLAMLIEYYEPGQVSVDKLLDEGIAAKAFLEDAGWIHSGLANLVKKYGLHGQTYDYSASNMESAYSKLTTSLKEGPVMASVFYTFDPQSPIPHLVVINSIDGDIVYYNDPSDQSGNRSISTTKFKKAWKKRFIEVRPA